jgi:hypothetical protein
MLIKTRLRILGWKSCNCLFFDEDLIGFFYSGISGLNITVKWVSKIYKSEGNIHENLPSIYVNSCIIRECPPARKRRLLSSINLKWTFFWGEETVVFFSSDLDSRLKQKIFFLVKTAFYKLTLMLVSVLLKNPIFWDWRPPLKKCSSGHPQNYPWHVLSDTDRWRTFYKNKTTYFIVFQTVFLFYFRLVSLHF